jgi:hypothetical protein
VRVGDEPPAPRPVVAARIPPEPKEGLSPFKK